MKFSKIGALLLTLACLLLPFSSASAAGAGVWDNIGRRASRPVNFIQRKSKAIKAVVVKIKFPSA